MEGNLGGKRPIAGARSTVLYLVGSLLQGLGLLLIQPFAIRVLDGVEWGLVSTAVVTIQVMVVLLSAGLPLAITQRWFADNNGQSRALAMFGFLNLGCMAIGLLGAVGVLATAIMLSNTIPWTLILALVSIGFLGAVLGAQAVLRAQDRPILFVTLSIGSSVVANLAGLMSIFIVGPSAVSYLTAYAVVVFATALLAIFMVRPKLPWTVPGVVAESVRIAVPLLPHTGALMLLTQGAVILLAATSGATSAGHYGAILIFATGPLTVLNALNNSWAPRIMSAAAGELSTKVREVLIEAVVCAAVVGILASAAATLGSTVLTRDPELLAPVSQVLPLMSLGYAAFLVASDVVYVVNRTSMMAYLTPLALVLAVAAAVVPAMTENLLALGIIHASGFIVLGVFYWLATRNVTHRAWPIGLFLLAFGAHAVLVILLLWMPVTFAAGIVEALVASLAVAALAWLWFRSRPARIARSLNLL